MALHPQAAAFLEQLARLKTPSIDTLPIDVTRLALMVGIAANPNAPSLSKIENRNIKRPDGSELPIRIYTPHGAGPFGVCLYFHGGGWVLNNLDTHDDLVRHLAAEAGCVFVSVDYRLAPEHKYPDGLDDAYTSLTWVHDHAVEIDCDIQRIAVSGDSAGGNLAAAVCLMTRDRGGPKIAYQALIYPITDCDFERPSYLENAEGYFLTRREMIWFWNQYVSAPDQMFEPYASPIRAASLRDLPPALVLTAEYDPLRDEGEAFAAALRAAGVETKEHRYNGLIHAFLRRVQQFDTAREAIRLIAVELRAAFAKLSD